MRGSGLITDDSGKEAFAYLAVVLLTMTTFYVSYRISLERDHEEQRMSQAILGDIEKEMDIVIEDIDLHLIPIHDRYLIDAEKRIGSSHERLDHVVEGMLLDVLEIELDHIITSRSKMSGARTLSLLNWSLSIQPILGKMEISVPSSKGSSNTSGLSGNIGGPVILGVNTTIDLQFLSSDADRGLTLRKDHSLVIRRMSVKDILNRRIDRFEGSLEDGEMSSLLEYIIGSLAQMKCTMGYGRVPGEGEIIPITVLSHEEILGCLDLSLLLLSQAHVRCVDNELFRSFQGSFQEAPGADGNVDLKRIIEQNEEPIDPAMIPILAEGIYHEDNPPSIDLMLRPIFFSMVDLIVNRLVSYVGLDEELLRNVGSLKAVFDLGVEAANSISRSLIGEEIIDASQETALSIFKGMLRRSDLMDPGSDNIMVRSIDGILWNGSSLDNYPEIEIPGMIRTYEIGLSDGKDEDMFYRSANGTIHSKAEYYDHDEEYYGMRCNIYQVTADFSFDPIEPPFRSYNLLEDPDFISSLALFLGTESGDGNDDDELLEKGRYAVKKVTDGLFDILTSSGNDDWENMWVGWNCTDPPSLCDDMPPLSSMVAFQSGPLLGLAGSFASSLINELTSLDFITSLASMEEGYQQMISDWISVNYDRWARVNDQMRYCTENRTELIIDNCTLEGWDAVLTETDVIYTGIHFYPGKDNLTFFDDYPELSVSMGLGLAPVFTIDNELLQHWSNGVIGSISQMREREFNDGTNGNPTGWIRHELEAPSHRGFELTFSSYSGKSWNLTEEVNSLLRKGMDQIATFHERDVNLTGGRFLVPPFPENSRMTVISKDDDIGKIDLSHSLSITRDPAFLVDLIPTDGTYNTDPLNGTTPYETRYSLSLKGDVSIHYRVNSTEDMVEEQIDRMISLDLGIGFKVRSHWEMYGARYTEYGTFWEYALDRMEEAKGVLKAEVQKMVDEVLNGSMPSLRELPPVIIDIVKGKELELFEIARILSNISLDLSSTLRDTVKTLIGRIMELGIRGILNLTCEVLGIDEIDLSLDVGMVQLDLHTQRKALMGGKGTLLNITMDLLPIGMHCFMSFNRLEKGKFDFNGTVTFDIGPLYVKLEMDPFMTRSPHMVSIGVRFDTGLGKIIRASFDIPTLEEFRSCEVSIGDTLGIEPFIPIPILGIQAVINAGFRLRYRMPQELLPHINEVNITNLNITEIEIFNPRLYNLYGSTIDMESRDGDFIASWRLEPVARKYMVVGINRSCLWRWKLPIPGDGMVRIVLRSPSGVVLDDLMADLSISGHYSRDTDGFGIWRYSEGSMWNPNGGPLSTGLRSLLVSIALTSIKEAWNHAYNIYGLSFDMIVPFLEMAIDLFMQRFLSLVRELVIDVRMFLSIEIEDSSGSAGGGLELSFSADGEAIASFLEWLYGNIKIFVQNLMDPHSAGNYRAFPWEILSRCYIGLDIFLEMEMPISVASMAPKGVEIPDSFYLGITAKVNLAVPLKLMGKDVGGGYISLGIYIVDAPESIVSLFYDIGNIGMQQDFYLLKAAIWEESIEMI